MKDKRRRAETRGVRRPARPQIHRPGVELIERAKNPLIIVSSAPTGNELPGPARILTEDRHYVVHTQMGKGVISDDCAYSLFATGFTSMTM